MNKRHHTNQVLYNPRNSQYFLPVYLRVLLKKITSINIPQAQAEMSATLILTIYHQYLPTEILEGFANKLQLTINNETNIKIQANQNCKMHKNKVQNLITYIYRDKFPLELGCNVLFTPFETLELGLTISLRSLQVKVKEKYYLIKFNMMDNEWGQHQKFSLQNDQNVGNYGFVQSRFFVTYSSSIKKKQQKPVKNQKLLPHQSFDTLQSMQCTIKKRKIINWQHAKFQFQLYRFPLTDVITIFIPLWLLSIINLVIFFQDNSLSGRVSSIATLMVAYSAFIPTIRARIPPSPHFTFIDFFVYSLLFLSILCLLRSYLDSFLDSSTYSYNWRSDPLFIVCLTIFCLSVVLVILALLLHKFLWQPSYKNHQLINQQIEDFISHQWNHRQCDEYFQKIGQVYPLSQQGKQMLLTNYQQL